MTWRSDVFDWIGCRRDFPGLRDPGFRVSFKAVHIEIGMDDGAGLARAYAIRPYFYFGIFGGVEEETELSDPKNPPDPLYKRGRKPLSEQPAKVELLNHYFVK